MIWKGKNNDNNDDRPEGEPMSDRDNSSREETKTSQTALTGESDPTSGDTASSVEEEHVAKLREEAEANYDKYLRAVADLENAKKRFVKERSDLIRYAGEQLARDLLEVVDNLQLAVAAADNLESGIASGSAAVSEKTAEVAQSEMSKGIRLVLDQFVQILDRHSIKGESALGKSFDPTKHEALASVPSAEKPPGTILEEFKRAYFFKDKLLRPAQVVVSSEVKVNGAGEGNS